MGPNSVNSGSKDTIFCLIAKIGLFERYFKLLYATKKLLSGYFKLLCATKKLLSGYLGWRVASIQ
jgi:hypothetical protein